MSKPVKRTRNPVARAVKTSRFKNKIVPNKKKKIKGGYNKYNRSYI